MNLNTLFGIQKVSNINILHQLFIYFYHLACECFIIKNHHRSWQVKGCKIIPIFKRSWHIVLYLQYHGASVLEVSSKRPRTKATPDLREIIKTRKNSGECFSMLQYIKKIFSWEKRKVITVQLCTAFCNLDIFLDKLTWSYEYIKYHKKNLSVSKPSNVWGMFM